MKTDKTYMRQALLLAEKGLGRTAPNPPVGAVVVKDGRVAGRGFHPGAGMPHAEIYALRDAGDKARGATIYVTLEPCSHYGKTPPCTLALIEAGIKRVVVGAVDPNPVVAGKGIEFLRSHGIEVLVGVEREAAEELIRWYAFWMRSKRPFVIAKAAMTLDGRIAAPGGDSKWISSQESRTFVHVLRNHTDGILVGIGTILCDDPELTCRIKGGRDPLRIVLDKDFQIPQTARVLGERCLIFTAKDPGSRPEITASRTAVVRLPLDDSDRFAWRDILEYLGNNGLHAILVEGGKGVHSGLIQSGSANKILFFVAPKLLGGGIPLVSWDGPERIADACSLVITQVKTIGCDVLIEASPGESCSQV
ncbi:MAG: bifunctional diaminohydroxyphosphoribosylaminopyrimidine deaminase/5-amino-6-(5-phosphoribosylamino)uracil reductase RibD [Deltaproteobacteria bacterium]|nr:bifunctional diaminohydroxyphosphoribosylaminopyrimidine deaminase/5-amino-6-(5-phosphoribosylamino)uracil reductase RibD [Deltaproteobacteria bacterium]